MKLRIVLSEVNGLEGRTGELFQALPQKGGSWRAFSCSLVAHVTLVWLAGSYVRFEAEYPQQAEVDVHKARILELSAALRSIPKWHAPGRAGAGTKRRSGAAAPLADPTLPDPKGDSKPDNPKQETEAANGKAPDAPEAPAAARPIPRAFVLPTPRKVDRAVTQTLLQPDLPPTFSVKPDLTVPELMILTAVDPKRVPPKPFVAPPQRKETPKISRDITVVEQAPVPQPVSGVAKAPEWVARVSPKLPPPPPAPEPMATIAAEDVPQPINVISIPERPVPLPSSIVLPALNQVAARDSAVGDSGGSRGAGGASRNGSQQAPANSNGSGSNPTGRGPEGGQNAKSSGASATERGHGPSQNGAGGNGLNAGHRSVNGTGTGTGPLENSEPGGEGAENGTANAGSAGGSAGNSGSSGGSGPGSGSGRGSIVGIGEGSAGSVGLPPDVAKMTRPKEGHYEVAVVQSAGMIPGSNGLLQGRPVYTVYLAVGDRKAWVLQYCSQGSVGGPNRSQVVQIGAITPISAPYAYVMFRPVVHFRTGLRYGFIHGYVNEAGKLEKLTEAGEPSIENLTVLLDSLRNWEFRPALKDGVAIGVEVLLCIPNLGG